MRPVLPGDLDAAVRCLICADPPSRAGLARELVARADVADRFRKHVGRAHARFGDGSLMAAARLSGPQGAAWRCDALYCACLVLVVEAIEGKRAIGQTMRHQGG